LTHIFIVLDKFTKWIKAKPTAAKPVEFISEIMYWFGITNNTITDNGTQFTAREFRDFYKNAVIKVNYVSVLHPQSNRQAK
jgi:hypothetical protein